MPLRFFCLSNSTLFSNLPHMDKHEPKDPPLVLIMPLVLLRILFFPTVAGMLLVKVLAFVGLLPHSPAACLIFAPAIYVAWLLVYLALCCLEMALLRPFNTESETDFEYRQFSANPSFTIRNYTFLLLYARRKLLLNLPVVEFFATLKGFRQLVFNAYSIHTHLAPTCTTGNYLPDPDITYIGHRSITGDSTRLVAHTAIMQHDGSTVFRRAAIRIGDFVTVGGNAVVMLGTTIGDGALVEADSYVPPFTRIGANEVWGGNPAVLIRIRDGVSAPGSGPAPLPSGTSSIDEPALQLIARALAVPVETMKPDSRMQDLAVWDSLGQMSISAALHDRYGIMLDQNKYHLLDSVAAVAQIIRDHRDSAPERAAPE